MSFMQATSQVWPSVVSSQPWPSKGVSYTYEHRGYVRPEKLEYWLRETFGHGASKYVVFNSRIYIKAPRKPTEAELDWLGDRDPDTSVYVEELRRKLRLPSRPASTVSASTSSTRHR